MELFQVLLKLFLPSSIELCQLVGETELPLIIFNHCKNQTNSTEVRLGFLSVFSKLCLFSQSDLAVNPFELFDLLLNCDDGELLNEIIYNCCTFVFHYQSTKQQSVDIAEYKNVTKLLKFIIHSIGKASNPNESLNWITFMASISLNSSVGIKFFSYSNVEMCLKLLSSIFSNERDGRELKISGILCLIFLFEGSNSSAINNILKSQESTLFDTVMMNFYSKEIVDFELFFCLLRLCKTIRKAGFSTLADKIVKNQMFINALARWVNGFGLECVFSCRFIEEEIDEIPNDLLKIVSDLCVDVEFLNHFYSSGECSFSCVIPTRVYSLAYRLMSVKKQFISLIDQNACLDYVIEVLKSNSVVPLVDCCLFTLILHLFQLIPTSTQLPQPIFVKICKTAQFSSCLVRILFHGSNNFLFQICMKNILYFAQQYPQWYEDFCKHFKLITNRHSKTEQILFQLVEERKKYFKNMYGKFNVTLKTLNESFEFLAVEFDYKSKQLTELNGVIQFEKEESTKLNTQIDALQQELKSLKETNEKELNQMTTKNETLTNENSTLKLLLERLKTENESLKKESKEKEQLYSSSIKSQHELIRDYRKKVETSLSDIDEFDQLLVKIESHSC